MKFTYVEVTAKGCKGWINLFFGDDCIALVKDVDLAAKIKAEIKEKGED